ncbi:MAG: hypothetical protein SOY61_04495, partial [Campylobacter sp.]|nr:hypothetical protein [Campylobacter sp.]
HLSNERKYTKKLTAVAKVSFSKIPSLRGVSETNDEAISFKIQSLRKFRHCEALKKPKQSRSKLNKKS